MPKSLMKQDSTCGSPASTRHFCTNCRENNFYQVWTTGCCGELLCPKCGRGSVERDECVVCHRKAADGFEARKSELHTRLHQVTSPNSHGEYLRARHEFLRATGR
ncbi:unnamed protein product [Amoebophrya sp. A120]|nr:unnamed protein product [Amoebophrya sp. A120]|eukprot:GSA120T00024441001.1